MEKDKPMLIIQLNTGNELLAADMEKFLNAVLAQMEDGEDFTRYMSDYGQYLWSKVNE